VTARSAAGSGRWAWAEIDLGAVRHNIAVVREAVAPAAVWAVVKADAYGHGAVPVARAAIEAGATGLCVALVTEGVELRRAGIEVPILLLSEQPPGQLDDVVRHRLISTVYTAAHVDALIAAHAAVLAAAHSTDHEPHSVHLKIDTGMHRVGCAPAEAVALATRIVGSTCLELGGVFTHLAVADAPDDPFTTLQMQRLDEVLSRLLAAGIEPPLVHAANSAGALAHPLARRSMVRVGIAAYGIVPGPGVAGLCTALRPALALRARVSFVRRLDQGEQLSYGLRHRIDRPTNVATIPIGYADGVPRRLFEVGGEVLIGGRRRRILGVVTMDQVMVDVGDDPVQIGDDVVLIGEQGAGRITAEEWADRLGTVGYEMVCGISRRIERRYD
jgi:alanine racemase